MSSLTLVVPAGTAQAAPQPIFKPLAAKARLLVLITGILGAFVVASSLASWVSADLLKYTGFLLMAIFSSRMRISVPGMPGTLSLNFVFVLFGLVDLSSSETVILGAAVTLVQCIWSLDRKARPAQVVFNTAAMAVAIAITEQVYHSPWLSAPNVDVAIRLAVSTCALFFLYTLPVGLVVARADG